MRPVRTAGSNTILTGPPGVGDLYSQREDWGIVSVWYLDPLERLAIAAGANIMVQVMGPFHPPISVMTTPDEGIGDDAPEVLERMAALKRGEA